MLKPIYPLFAVALLITVITGCAKAPAPQQPQKVQGVDEAVELKQKFGELANQLIATTPGETLKGFVAAPAIFIDENDPVRPTSLGRLIAESVASEFNQAGIPTQQYEPGGALLTAKGINEKSLLKQIRNQKCSAVITGGFLAEKDAVFVNARLLRASDGAILRTAELTLPNSQLVASLSRGSGSSQKSGVFISSQSAPVLAPSYPSLAGDVVQTGTASIPIVQGK